MEISEMFYEMSKPYNEKYLITFKYFCSFIGLRFNLKKTFQQKDSVGKIKTNMEQLTRHILNNINIFYNFI